MVRLAGEYVAPFFGYYITLLRSKKFKLIHPILLRGIGVLHVMNVMYTRRVEIDREKDTIKATELSPIDRTAIGSNVLRYS